MSAPRRFRHAEGAKRDARDIWFHIAEESVRYADAQLARSDRTCALLAEHPLAGKPRPELAPGLRSIVEGSYLIFYYPRASGPEIVRILHGKRNITSDLF